MTRWPSLAWLAGVTLLHTSSSEFVSVSNVLTMNIHQQKDLEPQRAPKNMITLVQSWEITKYWFEYQKNYNVKNKLWVMNWWLVTFVNPIILEWSATTGWIHTAVGSVETGITEPYITQLARIPGCVSSPVWFCLTRRRYPSIPYEWQISRGMSRSHKYSARISSGLKCHVIVTMCGKRRVGHMWNFLKFKKNNM